MKAPIETPETKTPAEKKVWQSMNLYIIDRGNVNSGSNPLHKEATFTFIASNPAHTKKYGYVQNAPHAATFTYSQLQHS